ncbi:zinc finger, matrin-type 2 [Entomortierella chlamydospora]|uniref:Zinc finger, matrin-type 2 n=1 Tax=Entomortierella chlamydospora TaxID=101097 RepID=A0A9P6MR67_9FUNG|nr:zinc finger, matrin-type 2 [Entomortierella chlamydospora]KAG0009749.1 zinc finger, matrin-type 2 [Entomortierella chlamydospora]
MSSSQKKGAYGTVEKKKSGRWDMEEMERRAKERAQREKELREEDELRALGKSGKKKTKTAPTEEAIAAERSERLVLESAVGKTQVVQGGPAGRAPGFYCKVCDCVLKDSKAYMDHRNGRNHLKNMGVDTKAVREDVSDVIAKLESMKRKAEEPKKNKYDLDARLEEVKRQEDRERAEKRERKKQKKNEKKADDTLDDGGMDPAMAALMGFSGFGSSKS